MRPADTAVDQILRALAPLGAVSARRMFGGTGFFLEGAMFAMAKDGAFFVKSDSANEAAFDAADCPFFRFERNGREVTTSYRRVASQAEAAEGGAALLHWARLGVDAASRARG